MNFNNTNNYFRVTPIYQVPCTKNDTSNREQKREEEHQEQFMKVIKKKTLKSKK